MPDIPSQLIAALSGLPGFDEHAFLQAHEAGTAVTSIRINPAKPSEELFDGSLYDPVPWSQFGRYLSKRPSFTFDPLFHAGCYYVQEASSMFLEQAVKQLCDTEKPLTVLDLSAAPGGKSTHLQSLLRPESLLVSNDVIRNRALTLKQNIIKWGSSNVIVTSNDPQHFQRLPGFFDLIVVDAPCSGSGLFRKDANAIDEWSESNVMLCHGRQKRILADILPSLKNNGVLIYSTCSYSVQENEEIGNWLIEEYYMTAEPISIGGNWGVVESKGERGSVGYRFYPDKLKGEGFFLSCFRKKGESSEKKKQRVQLPEKISSRELEMVSPWIKNDDLFFFKHERSIIAIPASLKESFAAIQSHLFIQYAGTLVGEMGRDKLVPDHALALSGIISENISRVNVSLDDAILYLQKGEMSISPEQKGWQLLCYKGYPLGWVNILSNRINNYYPKDLRILKQRTEPD